MKNDFIKNEYWDKEEFEDSVASGLINLFETNIKKHHKINPQFAFTDKMLERIRKIGCYFPPSDRVVLAEYVPGTNTLSENQKLDVINDGFPDRAVFCKLIKPEDRKYENDMREGAFLETSYIERIDKLPRPITANRQGKPFRLITVWLRNKFLEGHSAYFTVDDLGNTGGVFYKRSDYDPIRKICRSELVNARTCQSKEESASAQDTHVISAAFTHQYWADRRFLWNVTAQEGIARATFGVYPEQIKSLFYSRELPMTETGRKRPILHWVASHHRRMKSGIDIDIEKHLRGINEFVFQGTKYIITRPIKGVSLE